MSQPTLEDKQVLEALLERFGEEFGGQDDPDTKCVLDEQSLVAHIVKKSGLAETTVRASIERLIGNKLLRREDGQLSFFDDDGD